MNTKREKITMTDKLYDIIARTSIELGHKTDGKTMAALTKIFANDVATDKRLKRRVVGERFIVPHFVTCDKSFSKKLFKVRRCIDLL